MKYLLSYLVFINYIDCIFCLKLLLIFSPPARSHYILGNALAKGLAGAGHEVTMVSPFSEKNAPKNYKEIVVSTLLDMMRNNEGRKKFNMFKMENVSPVSQLIFIAPAFIEVTRRFFENSEVQKLLRSDEHFDGVIVEQFGNDACKIFAYHFKAPLILFNTIGPNRWVNNLVANPEPCSYVPDVFLGFNSDMSFWERMYNFIFGVISNLHLHWYSYPKQNEIMRKYYPNAPSFDELQYNISLVLSNYHESVGQSVPHVPNMIDIGGFHVSPSNEFPQDLKKFIENAQYGVIYFSMGSNIIPSQMPKEKKDAILKVLGSRKENILWKWDEDILDNKPDNVFISKWFPQQAILAHQNCKLFITHGGMLSSIEAIYLGKPVLAVPIYADQKLNAARAVSLGYGKSIVFSQINKINFAEAVNELIENSSYLENAIMRSKIMHDRPIKPMDLAIYWIEYVIRHKGAQHLRVAGINLPLYKYYMLDVIGIILGGLVLAMYLLSQTYSWMKSKNIKTKNFKSKKD